MRSRTINYLHRALIAFGGVLIATAGGLLCLHSAFADRISRLSYDLPFVWRPTIHPQEAVLVYLDEESAKKLNQPVDNVWNRALHTQLLDLLAKEGARLVFYDVVYDAPSGDTASDEAFAESIRLHGKVILGAALDIVQPMSGIKQERVLPPIKLLRKAAAGWGLLAFKPVDPDYGVRQLFAGTAEIPTATWKAVEVLGGKATSTPRETSSPRWINYYGAPNTFSSVNFAQALAVEGVPPNYFRDKIVLIGGRSAVSYLGMGRDEFVTPYSKTTHFSTGLEVHATILLNLLREDWLNRMPLGWETGIIVLVGLLAGALALFRPLYAFIITLAVSLTITCLACWWVWNERVWFDWLVPAAVQMSFGLSWSVGAQYLLESRRRKKLRSAFSFYLSPQMADKISDSDFDLTPGGKLIDATVMFTDLENFTKLSEGLGPAELSSTLIAYFEQTTRCILDRHGTILDYFGDAVMAGWGAPIAEPDHAKWAAEAACDLRCLAEIDVRGKKLRTRIGVNTGEVLAGNLGSSFRFDYTMIGDTTNFASRLESLNKHFGTQALISEAVRLRLDDKFVTRRLGEFRVAGKDVSVVIHELICRRNGDTTNDEWIECFEEGLEFYRAAEFEKSRAAMNQTRDMRGGSDGPAGFYLEKLTALEAKGPPENWTGIIEFTEK